MAAATEKEWMLDGWDLPPEFDRVVTVQKKAFG